MNDHRELLKALLDGKKITCNTWEPNEYIYLTDNGLVDEHGGSCDFTALDFDIGDFYILPEWYQRIPKDGILCWVSSTHEDFSDRKVALVIEYCNKHFFDTFPLSWKFARPLTEDESQNLIDNTSLD